MYVLWDDIYDIYKRENWQVVDSPFISYFSGVFYRFEGNHVNVDTGEKIAVKLACSHISNNDDGNRKMHLMLEKKDEISISFILESCHIHGMK